MQVGFEILAAKPKGTKADQDQPSVVPMRAGIPAAQRRAPSTDQKKIRRQMQTKTAVDRSTWDADFAKLDAAIKPYVIDFGDGSQGIGPDAPADLVSAYQGLMQMGYANGFIASRRIAETVDVTDTLGDSLTEAQEIAPPQTLEPDAWTQGEYSTEHFEHQMTSVKESTMDPTGQAAVRELDAKESVLITALSTPRPLAEQRKLAAELETVKAQRRAVLAAHRDILIEDVFVHPMMTPVHAYERTTSQTDWMLEEPDAPEAGNITQAMRAEASAWWNRVHPAVKDDADELRSQATGMARHVAGRYGVNGPAAERAFIETIAHLRKQADDSWPVGAPPDASGATPPGGVTQPTAPVINNADGVHPPMSGAPDGGKDPGSNQADQPSMVEDPPGINASRRTASDWNTGGSWLDHDNQSGRNVGDGYDLDYYSFGNGRYGWTVRLTDATGGGPRSVASGESESIEAAKAAAEASLAEFQGGYDFFGTTSSLSTIDLMKTTLLSRQARRHLGGGLDNLGDAKAPPFGEDEDDDEQMKEARRIFAESEGGSTCSVCGDSIARDPEGEEPRTWHHTNGTSHDHEANPGGSTEARRRLVAGRYCKTHQVWIGEGNASNHDEACKIEEKATEARRVRAGDAHNPSSYPAHDQAGHGETSLPHRNPAQDKDVLDNFVEEPEAAAVHPDMPGAPEQGADPPQANDGSRVESRRVSYARTIDSIFSKVAGDAFDENGRGESSLPDVEVGSENDKPMWPWELPEGADTAKGEGAANVADVRTPGGEAGYPQPKGDKDKQAAFRARVQANAGR